MASRKPNVSEVVREIEEVFRSDKTHIPDDGFMSMQELVDAFTETHGFDVSSYYIGTRLRAAKREGRLIVERRPRMNIADERYMPVCYKLIPSEESQNV